MFSITSAYLHVAVDDEGVGELFGRVGSNGKFAASG
jgi:hypothetical protein